MPRSAQSLRVREAGAVVIGTDDLPELVPARMVNEFVYCPRLCYLEWAQQRWEPNDDTAAGAFRHHSTDAKGGVLPDAAAGDHAPLSTFSVTMSDEGWGLTGVIDRIDHTADGAVPVDLKKGHPRADGTPWPADRIQALCQAALLEANGFRVTEAHLSYDEGHCRVAVPWDDPARRDLTAVLADLRTALCASVAPLPLLDDPRCPRCSRTVPGCATSSPTTSVNRGAFVGSSRSWKASANGCSTRCSSVT